MGRELGRISGPLLSDNLLRNGRNLVVDSDLFLLNVGSKRLGVNTLSPSRELTIASTTVTTNLLVDTQAELANFVLTTHQIQNPISSITISPAQTNPVITTPGLATSLLTFSNSTLQNSTLNSNINFNPTGTGVTTINKDALVNGNVHATGNITWDGDIQFGNDASDTITFAADINSNVIPNLNNTYDFGSSTLTWRRVYSKNIDANLLSANLAVVTTATLGNIKFEGNTVSNVNSSNDITVSASGTGLINFNGTNYVNGNEFPVPSTFTLNSTANGYTKFSGTAGLVVPSGPTVGPEGVELGMLRFNTELGYVRVFNGTNWQPVGGISATLSKDEVTDVMWAWDLILG
jgi:hypothetical protein